MKIILSRKGFDTTTGGKPSPILDNRFLSLPIPEGGSGIRYQDLIISETLNYEQLMHDLSIVNYQEAHLDPDLRFSTRYRDLGWKPLFGQHGGPQGVLHNLGVGPGDLFLFFGYFKDARRTLDGIQYFRNARKTHAIFGYLQIESIIDICVDSIPQWAKYLLTPLQNGG
jgi:hypothetical protein